MMKRWIAAAFLLVGPASCAHPLSIPASGRLALRPAIEGKVLDVSVRDPADGTMHVVTLRVTALSEEFIDGVVRREYVQLEGPGGSNMHARIPLPADRRRRIAFADVEAIAVLDVRAEDFASLCRGGRWGC